MMGAPGCRPEECVGKTALTHDRREHKKLPKVWGTWGSYEGYLADMVPRIGARAVADALGIAYGTVRRDCVRLGISLRRTGCTNWALSE